MVVLVIIDSAAESNADDVRSDAGEEINLKHFSAGKLKN